MIEENPDITRARLLFHILSNETRLKILLLLLTKEMNVKEIEKKANQTQSAISHQLSLMRKHRLITAKKVGREHYYRVIDQHLEQILKSVMLHISE